MGSALVSLVSLVVAVVSLAVALNLRYQLRSLREQLKRPLRDLYDLTHQQPTSTGRSAAVERELRIHDATPAPVKTPDEITPVEWLTDELPESTPAAQTASAEPAIVADKVSWEEKLGAKLPIWIGAVALVMAGVFMVRYFAQKGLLGPETRMLLAGSTGLGLIAFAQWLRRRKEQIAQGLAAAGIGILYATLLGSVNLHHLISSQLGLAGMIVTTAAAVGLSLQHGRIVAFLGLAGGFLMPALLGTQDISAVQFFCYIFLLQTALAVTGRGRKWWLLSLSAVVCSFAWVFFWILFRFEPQDAPWLGLFLIVSMATSILAACESEDTIAKLPVALWHGLLSLGIGLPLAGWLLRGSGFAVIHWLYIGTLGAGCMVLARLRPRFLPLSGFACGASFLFLVIWGVEGVQHPRFTWVCLGLGSLWSVGSYIAHLKSGQEVQWLALAGSAAVAGFATCYAFATDSLTTVPWWMCSVALGAVGILAAIPVGRRERDEPRTSLATALVPPIAFFAFAVPMELERQWIAVAWAVMVPAVALVCRLLKVSALRHVVVVLSGIVTVRLLNPDVLNYSTGTHWLFNWLLYGFGVPIIAFVAAARILPSLKVHEQVKTWLDSASAVLAFVFVTLMVRHGFHPEYAFYIEPTLIEYASYSVAFSAIGCLLYAVLNGRNEVFRMAGLIGIFAGFAVAFFGCTFAKNPLWTHESVGKAVVLNSLLFSFGLPAALGGYAAWLMNKDGRIKVPGLIAGISTLVLSLLLITLEVRQAFQGPFLDYVRPANPEWYAYSVAWLVFAVGMLMVGLMTHSSMFRWASLLTMLVTVAKVFLFDVGNLEDMYRVVSFLGLGLSLFVVAWVYQHFVFKRTMPKPAS